MTNQRKRGCRVLSRISVIAALTVGTIAASAAQTMQQPYGAPSQTQYAAPPRQQELQKLPPAMRESVAETLAPCGGDFGLLGNLEAARHGVAQANPTKAPVCD
jgi:hypothetical protein